MAKIEGMIEQTVGWLREHRAERRREEMFACGIRLHALCDAYVAVGGNDKRWRKDCKVLRKDL
ncbi:hypothetical protein [Aestuariivirga sp.]|uniref:hypothetical protein n=1 Tax=Aestuariivirga sp. TaxID=2650926 RepID=UPI0039E3C740